MGKHYPGQAKMAKANASNPALAVMVTHGMEDFLENTLGSAVRCGFDMRHVHIFHSRDISTDMKRFVERLGSNAHLFELGAIARQIKGYRPFGTPGFRELMLQKCYIFERLFSDYDVVMYSDLDLVWLRNPLPYINRIMTHFDMAIKTEATATFPLTYCMGLAIIKDTQWSQATLDQLQRTLSDTLKIDENASDQSTFNAIIAMDPGSCSRIFALPEGIFPNGLLTSLLAHSNPEAGIMAGSVEPIAYHANWTIGTDNKQRLLARIGLWNCQSSK